MIQEREYKVQEGLYASGHVPRVIKYSDEGFYEEVLFGRTFLACDSITSEMIFTLAETIQTLHCSIDLADQDLFCDKFKFKNWSYDPVVILELITQKNKESFKDIVDYSMVKKIAITLKDVLRNFSYQPTIIHGDVSLGNVMVTPENKIYLIDWTDCRVDTGMSDIAQAIHLMRFGDEHKEVFLKTYIHSLNFPFFVDYLLLLHKLYDYINGKRKLENEILALGHGIENMKKYL
mgnify:CR=1 FL=1